VWFEKFVVVNEFIIKFVLIDGGHGCDGLRGLGLVPFVVPYYIALSCPLEDSGRRTGIAVGRLVSCLRYLVHWRLLGGRGEVGGVVRSSESSLKRGLT